MKTSLFWKVVAVCALVLVAVYAGILLRHGRPVYDKVHAGGASVDGLIAITTDTGNNPRLIVVNPSKKTILVYQTAQTSDNGCKLLAGRSYAKDEELCSIGGGAEIPYKQQGWTIPEVVKQLNDINRRSGAGGQ